MPPHLVDGALRTKAPELEFTAKVTDRDDLRHPA